MPNLKELGSPKFIGSITNKNITSIGYKWSKKSDISQCSNLQSIDVHNCSDLASFFQQIGNLQFLKKLSFFKFAKNNKSEIGDESKIFKFCKFLNSDNAS